MKFRQDTKQFVAQTCDHQVEVGNFNKVSTQCLHRRTYVLSEGNAFSTFKLAQKHVPPKLFPS